METLDLPVDRRERANPSPPRRWTTAMVAAPISFLRPVLSPGRSRCRRPSSPRSLSMQNKRDCGSPSSRRRRPAIPTWPRWPPTISASASSGASPPIASWRSTCSRALLWASDRDHPGERVLRRDGTGPSGADRPAQGLQGAAAAQTALWRSSPANSSSPAASSPSSWSRPLRRASGWGCEGLR